MMGIKGLGEPKKKAQARKLVNDVKSSLQLKSITDTAKGFDERHASGYLGRRA